MFVLKICCEYFFLDFNYVFQSSSKSVISCNYISDSPRRDPRSTMTVEVVTGESIMFACPICANPGGAATWTFEVSGTA